MKICQVEGCDRGGPLSRGMCRTHYMRWWSRGDAGQGAIGEYGRTGCETPDCDRKHFTHGYCAMHYKRLNPLVLSHTGPAHHLWAGSTPGYGSAHARVRRARGPASAQDCRRCSSSAHEWAYDHTDPNELWNDQMNLPYSADLDRYMPLCRSCHKLFDNAHRRMAAV